LSLVNSIIQVNNWFHRQCACYFWYPVVIFYIFLITKVLQHERKQQQQQQPVVETFALCCVAGSFFPGVASRHRSGFEKP
jgi:uncharacterized membrane protein SirB2